MEIKKYVSEYVSDKLSEIYSHNCIPYSIADDKAQKIVNTYMAYCRGMITTDQALTAIASI